MSRETEAVLLDLETRAEMVVHLAPDVHPEDFSLQATLGQDTRPMRLPGDPEGGRPYVCQVLRVPGLKLVLYSTVAQWGRLVLDTEAAQSGIAEELAELRGIDAEADVHELDGGPQVLVHYDDGSEQQMTCDAAGEELLGAIIDDIANKRWGTITDPEDEGIEWSAVVSIRLVKVVFCRDCRTTHPVGADCPPDFP